MKKRFVTLLMLLCLMSVLTLPVFASQNAYVFDTEGLLSDEAWIELEALCADAAETYGCGIYVVTLSDYTRFHEESLYAAEEIYRAMEFGIGENKNGILLMLSMSERDYAMVCYGDIANSAFTDRKQIYIEDRFLDDLAYDDWEGGLFDYVESCLYVLENFDGSIGDSYSGYYEDGVYYNGIVISHQVVMLCYAAGILVCSVMIALVACNAMKGMMKNTGIKHTAEEYIPQGGVSLRSQRDNFSHRTTRVIYHEDDSDDFDSVTTVRSSGFSGRSGKF